MATSEETSNRALRKRNWDALAATLAALIGFLALIVSGYTAYIQRQQVRAQVWPFMLVGYSDVDHSIVVLNKGTGPALVRSVEVLVDGKPLPKWSAVLEALGVARPDDYGQSTISGNVLSPGERLVIVSVPDDVRYQQFRAEATRRLTTRICYCSTLGECWMHLSGDRDDEPDVRSVDSCPTLGPAETFKD